jgi:hypothetical protein
MRREPVGKQGGSRGQKRVAKVKARQQRLAQEEVLREQHARLVVDRADDPRFVQRRIGEDGSVSLRWDPNTPAGRELGGVLESQLDRFRQKFGRVAIVAMRELAVRLGSRARRTGAGPRIFVTGRSACLGRHWFPAGGSSSAEMLIRASCSLESCGARRPLSVMYRRVPLMKMSLGEARPSVAVSTTRVRPSG